MRQNRVVEIVVGLFMLTGFLALLVLALKVSNLTAYVGNSGYVVTANFANIGDLKVRAPVTISGVRVGQVLAIHLDPQTFRADVVMKIENKFNEIPTDSSARILTQGLLGSNYISLSPGVAETNLKAGMTISDTQPALILENLIGQLLFKVNNGDKS